MESLPQESVRDGPSIGAASADRCSSGLDEGEAANDVRMSQLVRTIEQEIIPRLMLAHRSAPAIPSPAAVAGADLTQDDVQHFAKLMLGADEEPAFAAVFAHRARGVPVDRIYLGLLAPAARYLGELWSDDLCSFTDVTIGIGRLQRLLRELSPSFGHATEDAVSARSVLLLPSPGEQHTFGLVMVGEFFRRAGWSVSGGGWVAGVDAGALVAAERFDVIGFSLGAEIHLEALAGVIEDVRRKTCNSGLLVLVGGPLFAEHPQYVAMVGADGMTIDGREAPRLAERLIARHGTAIASAGREARSSGPT